MTSPLIRRLSLALAGAVYSFGAQIGSDDEDYEDSPSEAYAGPEKIKTLAVSSLAESELMEKQSYPDLSKHEPFYNYHYNDYETNSEEDEAEKTDHNREEIYKQFSEHHHDQVEDYYGNVYEVPHNHPDWDTDPDETGLCDHHDEIDYGQKHECEDEEEDDEDEGDDKKNQEHDDDKEEHKLKALRSALQPVDGIGYSYSGPVGPLNGNSAGLGAGVGGTLSGGPIAR